MTYFSRLKKEIGSALFAKNKVSSSDVSQWKGNDITSFQDDLMQKVNGRISEKWFYTHIKSTSEKLPRIDMLNLLSEYVGYKDWNDYKANNTVEVVKEKHNSKKTMLIVALAVLVIIAMTYIFSMLNQNVKYRFCFIDKDRMVSIEEPIEIEVLRENESSLFLNCDETGCIELESNEDYIKFVVRSAYYKTDTIVRRGKSNSAESVKLLTNDYALMIHIFSKSEVKSWKERRKQLKEMLHDDAQIFQINENSEIAMEFYNKSEFIDKLTMPTSSLKNIKVIDTKLQGGKIIQMRFIQKGGLLDE